jgi:hypothetical protein
VVTSLDPLLELVLKRDGEGGKNIGFGKGGKAKDKGLSGIHAEKLQKQTETS